MTSARIDGLRFMFLGILLFVGIGSYIDSTAAGVGMDFKAFYYPARCILQHHDPYMESEVRSAYLSAVGGKPTEPPEFVHVVTLLVNMPTLFTFVVPIALLPWGWAHVFWIVLAAAAFIVASLMAWDLAADYAPEISGGLLAVLLVTSVWIFWTLNAAGLVVSLAVIAVWCFLKKRFATLGVLCLASSLVIKPHDAGLVWLFFLLSGGIYRKRALQTLVAAIVLGLPGIFMVWQVSPHWMTELRSNVAQFSVPGGILDPGPLSYAGRDPDSVINLQTVVSEINADPRVYNSVSYLVAGVLVGLWAIAVLRSKSSPKRDLLALAAIAALSMIFGFHRQHDAKLLLLTFPAFAMLWSEGGIIGWSALGLTGGGILLNGDLTSFLRIVYTKNLLAHATGVTGTALTIFLARPIPLLLTATGIFYLWVYWRRNTTRTESDGMKDLLQQSIEARIPDAKSPVSTRPESVGDQEQSSVVTARNKVTV
jgi:hypothetical protein